MSLIHDSLRKLETKQVKDTALGFSSPEGSYSNNKSSSVKKLWVGIIVVLSIVLMYYAYTLLHSYQQQNENLLNDIKQMKSQNVLNNRAPIKSKIQTVEKVIVQAPAVIKKSLVTEIMASPERQKEVTELNKKLLKMKSEEATKPVLITNSRNTQINKTNAVQLRSPKASTLNITTSTKKINKKNKVHKLTVKQTRQLVNNLQMQIESKNSNEVNDLLEKLAKSSGQESLVFLRMKAYWSNINEDNATAMVMYKKILFQKPYDIQAGTNLALIEAKNNQKSQALKRLELLKNKYPSNKVIQEYFNRVEAN